MRFNPGLWLFSSLALIAARDVPAQQAAIPVAVARDANGDVVGPVVGFAGSLQSPMVRIHDPETGDPVFLVLHDAERLRGPVIETYYSMGGCSGTAYHDPSLAGDATLLPESTGYTYSIGSLDASGGWLFRSEAGDVGTMTAYQSRATFAACFGSDSGSKVLRAATPLFDTRNQYPPDYTLE